MKKLEDMNLVDNFLAYSLTAHKTYGEEASRYILECILRHKIRHLTVVPQKVWYGDQPENHGVRLDIYLDEEDGEIFDLEPDNNSSAADVAALPRRARFYHAKIDSGNFTAGEDYSNLRNVVVVFITTYDPFKRNRMIYTIQNSCKEDPELTYDDGARTIFLYTGGTEGNPPDELLQLARYMECSVSGNAQTAGLARLHEMVMKVKADREVGAAYMNLIEMEKRIKEKAKEEGREEGREEGHAEGREEGRAEEIIDSGWEFNLSEEDILERLQKKLNINPEIARKYLASYKQRNNLR
ncbi:MAG: Rpn family recombination-promoting nuclease/putative transposase [Acetatifactor sp.]|nr:Rpn family recombination-promoting nuclease/putative transposase [Acetatifactor sp.]